MPTLKVFTLPKCPNCPAAKKVAKTIAEKLGIDYQEVDMANENGRLEGLMLQIASTPTIVLDDEVLFRSKVPTEEELEKEIKGLLGKEE